MAPSVRSLRFRGGLVFKAHRLCVSLDSRLESSKEEEKKVALRDGPQRPQPAVRSSPAARPGLVRARSKVCTGHVLDVYKFAFAADRPA